MTSLDRPLRVLVVSALFPPDVIGGAEMSAWNLSKWLAGLGCDVGVVTAAISKDKVEDGVPMDGMKIWRISTPHIYPIFDFPRARAWLKPIWHLQDHFDPRNGKRLAEILDDFQPDLVNIHYIQGMGYNALREISSRRVPAVMFLHDLGLACVRMSMFTRGKNCASQCGLCKLSSRLKARRIAEFENIGFCSPSRANLEQLAKFFPVFDYPTAVVLNTNSYPHPKGRRKESSAARFIYVGRLHSQKGIDVLLEAAERLAQSRAITMTIVGGGPEEKELRRRYGDRPWCEFTGNVSQQEVAELMNNSDALCTPSIWLENSPGVVIQALGLGLPVIGSDIGGIPELVEDGVNGRLVIPGDVDAWFDALAEVVDHPARVAAWRDHCVANASQFEQDSIGKRALSFLYRILFRKPITHTALTAFRE